MNVSSMSSSVDPGLNFTAVAAQPVSTTQTGSALNTDMTSNQVQSMSSRPPSSTLDITRGGETAVTLSPDLTNALTTLQVQAQGFGGTDISDGIAEFGIIGGAANPTSAKVDIIHDGGLTFTSGNTTVNLTDFVITNLSNPADPGGAARNVVTGLVTVNGDLVTRAPLFDLQGGQVTPPQPGGPQNLTFDDVGATLTGNAANVLNQAFQVNAFTSGLNIGTADVNAQLSDPNQAVQGVTMQGAAMQGVATNAEQQPNSQSPFELVGTPDNDILTGAPGRDNIVTALDGNDTINTVFSGNDRLDGGGGDDSFVSGPGDDQIEGGPGTDFVSPGTGNDIVNGGPGNDFLNDADNGNNEIRGGEGDDRIGGGTDNDRLFGDSGRDVLFGGLGGDDILNGGEDDDFLGPDNGNDQVFGDGGNDDVNGGVGNDTLFGGTGNDTLTGVETFTPRPQEIGRGEIDTLTGNQGDDRFELGTVQRDGTRSVFYNDGDPAVAGTNDYALIADFGLSSGDPNNGRDVVQLVGSANEYSLGASPSGLPSGTGIFLNDGTTPELVGVVANVAPTDLSLTNSNQFTFV